MASEAIITEELICKAADQLAAEGVRPTNDAVRDLLAKWTGTKGGSYATIGPVLRKWKANRKTSDSAEPAREAAPQVVQEKVSAWASDLWGMAQELANARLASEHEALELARQELEAEASEALSLAERREDERDDARGQVVELNGQIAAMHVELSAQKERAAAAEARAAQVERRAQELHDELLVEKSRRDKEEAARRVLESELSDQRAEAARLTQQVTDLGREVAQLHADLAHLHEQHVESLSGARKQYDEAVAAVRLQHEAEVERLKQNHAEALKAQEQANADVTRKLEVADATLQESRSRELDATAQMNRLAGELEALRSQVIRQEETIRAFTVQKVDGE